MVELDDAFKQLDIKKENVNELKYESLIYELKNLNCKK